MPQGCAKTLQIQPNRRQLQLGRLLLTLQRGLLFPFIQPRKNRGQRHDHNQSHQQDHQLLEGKSRSMLHLH